jgi:integral membrane protein
MTPEDIKQLTAFQVNEITESNIYRRLANIQKDSHNSEVLKELSAEELKHYHILKKYTGKTPSPKHWKIIFYILVARLFGLTFGIKLMEKGEVHAQNSYRKWTNEKDLQTMADEEEKHENKLIALINEEGLNYMGAVVLGLNDALVEFTGALAGYTFALQNPKLIALTGSITGIAAALSMAASEYLSSRADNDGKNAIKASIYTGIAYIITVVVLIMPFVLMSNPYWALVVCLGGAVTIIAIFNYYYSIVKDESFKKRFLEMAAISIGIAAISFGIGYALRVFTGIDL